MKICAFFNELVHPKEEGYCLLNLLNIRYILIFYTRYLGLPEKKFFLVLFLKISNSTVKILFKYIHWRLFVYNFIFINYFEYVRYDGP